MTVTTAPASGRRESGGGVAILLVDDDEMWARTTGRLLEANNDGFAVTTANSLAEARQAFAAAEPDCVVCDYQLGDGTGLTLLETVREADPDRPFVLVTGEGDEAVATEAIRHGVTDYIRKDQDDDEAELLASRITNGVESYRTERALERERRSKTALLDVLTGTTAETDLAQQFCSQLVDERGYACAWIAREEGSGLVPRGIAGQEDYVDAVLTPGEPLPEGEPARRVLDADEPVGVRFDRPGEAGTDPQWARLAAEAGFEGAIAVPIRHDGVRFGVVAVYATDESLLTDRERRAVVEFAETAGYALTSAERKHSLMASSPVTLRVDLDASGVPLGRLCRAVPDGAALDLLSTVPREDGTTLYVAKIDRPAPDLDGVASLDGVQAVEDDPETTRCEFVVAEQTPEDLLAAHGVRITETTTDGTAVTLSLQLPDELSVSAVRELLDEAFAEANPSAIWTGRASESPTDSRPTLAELTERQRNVIQHAYEVGYFERPRETTATELAEQFDISRSTLTQHLRTAERKLLTKTIE